LWALLLFYVDEFEEADDFGGVLAGVDVEFEPGLDGAAPELVEELLSPFEELVEAEAPLLSPLDELAAGFGLE
jgi:hypothetical protein